MTKDMTKQQFLDALRRNGFKHEFMGWYADTTGQVPNVKFGAVYNVKPFRLNRRATLARLIQTRAKEIAKAEKQAAKVNVTVKIEEAA